MKTKDDVGANPEDGAKSFLKSCEESWSEEIGLWRNKSKHNRIAHDIRFSAQRLVHAGNLGQLDGMPADRVLATIRKAQQPDGPRRGNFWWSWEDGQVTDQNSGFFTCIQLLALHFVYREHLAEAARADLDHMLSEARHWFGHKAYPITEDKLRYPNAYFGDVACLWLIAEKTGDVGADLTADLERVTRYYLDEDWGWGEHLSDMYSKIILNELFALLMWGRSVPGTVRENIEEMIRQIMAIDAAFAGGPRVPAMRNKPMLDRSLIGQGYEPPIWLRPYTDMFHGIFPWSTIAAIVASHYPELVGRFSLPPREAQAISVPCHGGVRAEAWVDERWRIGVMSAYPLFPDMQTHSGYGLAIQDIPVVFWHTRGDWAYPQWVACEDGKEHALPAKNNSTAELEYLCRLSDTDIDACRAQTWGLRDGSEFLVFRRIPRVAASWTWAADRLRLLDSTEEREELERAEGWHCLRLFYPEEVLTVAYHPLGTTAPELRGGGEGRERFWGARWSFATDEPVDGLRGLWFMTAGTTPIAPPTLAREAGTYCMALPSGRRYCLDIEADTPWREIEGT